MFSRICTRGIAALMLVCTLSGCAEFDRRGGVISEVEDWVLFSAQTKSHRLFRSYLLIGALMSAARQANLNETDKIGLKGNMEAALAVAFEAYSCLYNYPLGGDNGITLTVWFPDTPKAENLTAAIGTSQAIKFQPPAICQFFDEKMARLDYALFRLALSALFNERANSQLANIRDKLIGEIPVVSAASKSAIFAVRATAQATNVADSLLNLTFESAGPVLSLLPLYRDALEMNMWVIVDNLIRTCSPALDVQTSAELPKDASMECQTLRYALSILANGNGDLKAWREFVRQMNLAGVGFDAYEPHFVLVSRLIWRSCVSLLTNADCKQVMSNAFNLAFKGAVRIGLSPEDLHYYKSRAPYSASIRGPSQVARDRFSPSAMPPPAAATAPAPVRDPQTTGAIPRGSTQGIAPSR